MVGHLRKELPEDIKDDLRRLIAADPLSWWVSYHFTFGMAVRNSLRQAGLGETQFARLGNLDGYWIRLVELAVEKQDQA